MWKKKGRILKINNLYPCTLTKRTKIKKKLVQVPILVYCRLGSYYTIILLGLPTAVKKLRFFFTQRSVIRLSAALIISGCFTDRLAKMKINDMHGGRPHANLAIS